MTFGICPLSLVPVRASASDKAEMVSQLLFGETFTIVKEENGWLKIETQWDHYTGWIDAKQALRLEDKQFKDIGKKPLAITIDLVQSAAANAHHIPLLVGSSLPHFDGLNFRLGKQAFVYNGRAIFPKETPITPALLKKCAMKYLHAPYLWGGRSPFGIDCSGFVQMVYKLLGIALPRDAYQQADEGRTVDFIDQAKTGDLGFFEKDGRITHTGIILQPEKDEEGLRIIHASGRVRIDRIDHFGIHNEETKQYSHKLNRVRRIMK